MKADAKSPAEKEALEWAIEFFRGRKDDLKSDRRRAIEYFRDWLLDDYDDPLHRTQAEESLVSHVEMAREGDDAAFQLICNFAGIRIANNKPLPENVRDFISEFLSGPDFYLKRRKPGPNLADLVFRDFNIWAATEHIVRTWNFKATRGREQKIRASATSIVREALEKGAGVSLGEDAVIDAWKALRSFGEDELESALSGPPRRKYRDRLSRMTLRRDPSYISDRHSSKTRRCGDERTTAVWQNT
jgi:hypothetical protein